MKQPRNQGPSQQEQQQPGSKSSAQQGDRPSTPPGGQQQGDRKPGPVGTDPTGRSQGVAGQRRASDADDLRSDRRDAPDSGIGRPGGGRSGV
ncbi:MAG: hypothetical protein AB1430_04495 [Pseudomonadota bacterium]